MSPLSGDVSIDVSTKGEVGDAAREAAREKFSRLAGLVREPVRAIDIRLTHERDPANERPCSAEVVFDVDGRPIRAHVAAQHMEEAIDMAADHLHRGIDRAEARLHRINLRRETGQPAADEWRHGDLPTARPHYFPRPVDEREVVRRKTFALAPITVDEAAFDLDQLGHDFYLFTELQTGADSVLRRRDDGEFELLCASATMPDLAHAAAPIHLMRGLVVESSIEEAEERLDVTDEPFVFFRSMENGRGNVLYRRRDGHYELIVSA
ncbi:MAG TPA: HPF/RaiA family ribosome-associated protein [Acidimicrobiales bacterium]|nr:HPF/RaiA family ribosome-associated protein [Acidimicrobiales bacterium]